MRKKIIKSVAIVIVVILVGLYFVVGNYFYNFAINASVDKEFMGSNPHLKLSDAVNKEVEDTAKLADEEFLKKDLSTDKYIMSNDKLQLKLHADILQNGKGNNKWAIVVHGYAGKIKNMTRWIRNFYDNGYNVLAPDLRGHGKSEGDYIGMGWDDRFDILSWINEITKINKDAEIVLFGVSMGGAAVMNVAGEELPSNVKVIIEDSGFTSTGEIFTYQVDELFGLPKFPALYALNTVTKIRAGYNIFDSSAIKQVGNSKVPMLFIHGDQDKFVPYEMLDEVYEIAKVKKEKLVIKGAGHSESENVDPKLYWKTIWGFVDQYIK